MKKAVFAKVLLVAVVAATVMLAACGGAKASTNKLANEVKASIQQKMDGDDAFKDYSITVDKVTLVRSGDYTFVGTAVMKTGGASHEVMLGVVADSQNLVWAAEPAAFSFLDKAPKSTLRAAVRAENILKNLQSGKPPVPNERTDFKYDLNGAKDGVVIVQYVGTRSDVVVPAEIDGFPVVTIAKEAFAKKAEITSVVLQPPLKVLSDGAFRECKNLAVVVMPNTLMFIADNVFSSCQSLVSANIPNSVLYIGRSAFYNCLSLSSVTLPNTIESIERSSFLNCSLLQSIKIPESVGYIFYQGFRGCSNLLEIELPSHPIVYIGGMARMEDDGYYVVFDGNTVSRYISLSFDLSRGPSNNTFFSIMPSVGVDAIEYLILGTYDSSLALNRFEKSDRFKEGYRIKPDSGQRWSSNSAFKVNPKNAAFTGCFRLDLPTRARIEQSGYEGGFN